MRRLPALLLALLALGLVPLAAEDPVGKIAYLDGAVTIVRDEASLAPSRVREGLAIENYDLFQTGADGELEVLVATPAAPATTVRVGPRTQFSLEIGKVGGRQQTTVDLVAGAVSMKCAKLAGSQAVRVVTDGAALGVRGTTFTVDAPVSGDVLVTCEEGEVEVTAEDGSVLTAAAGEAIERPRGGKLARLLLAGAAIQQARQAWIERRAAAWQRDPIAALRWNALFFDGQLARFNRIYDRVEASRRDVIAAWREERRAGIIARLLAVAKERADVRNDVRALRASLFRLERTFVRLLVLRDYCEQQGIEGRIGLLRTTKTLFARLERERAKFELRRAAVRWLARQYALRTDDRVPLGVFGDRD